MESLLDLILFDQLQCKISLGIPIALEELPQCPILNVLKFAFSAETVAVQMN